MLTLFLLSASGNDPFAVNDSDSDTTSHHSDSPQADAEAIREAEQALEAARQEAERRKAKPFVDCIRLGRAQGQCRNFIEAVLAVRENMEGLFLQEREELFGHFLQHHPACLVYGLGHHAVQLPQALVPCSGQGEHARRLVIGEQSPQQSALRQIAGYRRGKVTPPPHPQHQDPHTPPSGPTNPEGRVLRAQHSPCSSDGTLSPEQQLIREQQQVIDRLREELEGWQRGDRALMDTTPDRFTPATNVRPETIQRTPGQLNTSLEASVDHYETSSSPAGSHSSGPPPLRKPVRNEDEGVRLQKIEEARRAREEAAAEALIRQRERDQEEARQNLNKKAAAKRADGAANRSVSTSTPGTQSDAEEKRRQRVERQRLDEANKRLADAQRLKQRAEQSYNLPARSPTHRVVFGSTTPIKETTVPVVHPGPPLESVRAIKFSPQNGGRLCSPYDPSQARSMLDNMQASDAERQRKAKALDAERRVEQSELTQNGGRTPQRRTTDLGPSRFGDTFMAPVQKASNVLMPSSQPAQNGGSEGSHWLKNQQIQRARSDAQYLLRFR